MPLLGVVGALALLGCIQNPLRPAPDLSLARSDKESWSLDDFAANLELTDAVVEASVKRPSAKRLVDAQIAAMTEFVGARSDRGGASRVAPATAEDDPRRRLTHAALELLPYLDIDSGEAQLSRVAAGALLTELGSDAEFLHEPLPGERDVDLASELRDGVGVIRIRELGEGMSDRVLSVFNQWAALPALPRAIVLDISECEFADPTNTLALTNAVAPGLTPFQLEYRDQKSDELVRKAWHGKADWGIAAIARLPLFVWISGRSAELLEAAAGALREERGAILIGAKTAGSGRVKYWKRLANNRWFGFTTAYVLDAKGTSLRDRPLYPDACPVSGELVNLSDRGAAGYEAQCGKEAAPANLEAVLRYVASVTEPQATPVAAPAVPEPADSPKKSKKK